MNSNSHKMLADYLASSFLQNVSNLSIRLFKIGCTEPDRNLITYLKGSLRNQWFRGHNWVNSRNMILTAVKKLESKEYFTPIDYYRIGRLVHYVADAFTYAHNYHFLGNLRDHRYYEDTLEESISAAFGTSLYLSDAQQGNTEDIILKYRKQYLLAGSGADTDSAFIKIVCSQIMLNLSS